MSDVTTGLPAECAAVAGHGERGHHCGIRSSAEGGHSWQAHCRCPECCCVLDETIGIPLPELMLVPMCGLPGDAGTR